MAQTSPALKELGRTSRTPIVRALASLAVVIDETAENVTTCWEECNRLATYICDSIYRLVVEVNSMGGLSEDLLILLSHLLE